MNESLTIPSIRPDERVARQPVESAVVWIAQILTKTYALAGQSADKNSLNLICKEIMRDLNSRYRMLNAEEVESAFINGVKGDYGEFFGINVMTLNKWIKAYLEHDHYNYVVSRRDESIKMIAATSTITDEEKERIIREGIPGKFEYFRKTGLLIDFGNPSFRYLEKKGVLKLTPNDLNKAKKRLEKELELKKNSGLASRNHAMAMLTALSGGLLKNNVEALAMEMKLTEFFQKLIRSNKEITEYL